MINDYVPQRGMGDGVPQGGGAPSVIGLADPEAGGDAHGEEHEVLEHQDRKVRPSQGCTLGKSQVQELF